MENNRIHFWHYVLNESGQPIQDAEIRLYLQDSPTTEASIYTSESSSTFPTCSDADIKTDNDGYFEFWLEGEDSEGGYAHTTEFILEWYKAGTAPGYIYNYNPWPNALVWRDKNIGADVNYENKFISNYLANKWYGHANEIIPSASPHDIYPLDYESGCDDNTYNKVVSNKFIYDILVGSAAGDSFNLTSIYDGVQEHQELVAVGGWTTSGSLYYTDISHSNIAGDTVVKMVKTDGYEEIVPALVERLSYTITRVAIDDDIEAWVTIQGRELSSSSSSESSSSLSSSSSESSSSLSSSSISSSSSESAFTLTYTIDSSKIDENLTNFPVGIKVPSSFVSAGSYDTLHVTSGSRELYTEVDTWGTSGTIWTKVPFIPSGKDISLTLQYGAVNPYAGLTGTTAAQNVWDNNYVAVWHMSQNPTEPILDSTSNGLSGSPTNVSTSVDSPVGKGLELGESIHTKYVQTQNSDLSALQTAYTLESLHNYRLINVTYNDNVMQIGTSNAGDPLINREVTTGKLYCSVWGDNTVSTLDGPLLEWGYVAITFSGGTLQLFYNGVPDITHNSVTISNLSNVPVTLGNSQTIAYWSILNYTGESRISKIPRSNAWIKATNHVLKQTLFK
jgi:hypothetical protein